MILLLFLFLLAGTNQACGRLLGVGMICSEKGALTVPSSILHSALLLRVYKPPSLHPVLFGRAALLSQH